jgi:hypothetical protein
MHNESIVNRKVHKGNAEGRKKGKMPMLGIIFRDFCVKEEKKERLA